MSERMIMVAIEDCVQIGPDDFRMKRYSRIFEVTRSIQDILSWAENMGIKNPTINELKFFDHTGSSF